MFDDASRTFELVRKDVCPHRRSMITYSFTFHKLLQLLECDDLLCHFPLLKSTKMLYKLDIIWKGNKLHTPFLPVVGGVVSVAAAAYCVSRCRKRLR